MPRAADQVVALTCEFDQIVAKGQIAQAQQIGDRYLFRTGKTGSALSASIDAEAVCTLLVKMIQGRPLQCIQGPIAAGEGSGEIQVRRVLSAHAEGAHASRQEKPIGQMEGLEWSAVL